MAKKRRKRIPPTPGLIYRAGEVCVASTIRAGNTRKRIVDCRPVEAVEVVEDFTPHCTNNSCMCGVSYKDFRSGWTYGEAFEMVGGRGGVQFRPSQARVLRMMRRLKLDEWERHQRACGAPSVATPLVDEAYWEALPEDDFLAGTKNKRKPKKAPKEAQAAFDFENDSFALQAQDAPKTWGKFEQLEDRQTKLLLGSWKSRAPRHVAERRAMPKACFLVPGRRAYPICATGTRDRVQVDCGGLQAAYNRARQQGDTATAKRARALQRKHCAVSL